MALRRLTALRQHLAAARPLLAAPTAASARGLSSTMASASGKTTMRAVVLPEPGPVTNLKVTELPIPTPSATQVRIRVAACAVCHRDLLDRSGAFPFMQKPTVLGHEIAGTVESVGSGVKNLKVGDRVVSLHWGSCGACDSCGKGQTTHCRAPADFLALTANGGYAEYVVAEESAWVSAPAGWRSLDAAPVMCTYGTVWHGALTRGNLRPSETVLVTGASGGVGSAAVQIASRMGCRVIAVTSSEDKVPFLKTLGATDVIVSADGTFHKHPRVKGDLAPDLALEAVGAPTFDSSLRSLKRGGRMVLAGNVTVGTVPLKLGLAIINGLSVIGTDSCTREELKAVFRFMDETKLRPNISAVLPLEDAAKAHTLIHEKKVQGRIVLKVNEDW